ncbi:Axoneme-associated protein, partial [Ophiophagus hannah]
MVASELLPHSSNPGLSKNGSGLLYLQDASFACKIYQLRHSVMGNLLQEKNWDLWGAPWPSRGDASSSRVLETNQPNIQCACKTTSPKIPWEQTSRLIFQTALCFDRFSQLRPLQHPSPAGHAVSFCDLLDKRNQQGSQIHPTAVLTNLTIAVIHLTTGARQVVKGGKTHWAAVSLSDGKFGHNCGCKWRTTCISPVWTIVEVQWLREIRKWKETLSSSPALGKKEAVSSSPALRMKLTWVTLDHSLFQPNPPCRVVVQKLEGRNILCACCLEEDLACGSLNNCGKKAVQGGKTHLTTALFSDGHLELNCGPNSRTPHLSSPLAAFGLKSGSRSPKVETPPPRLQVQPRKQQREWAESGMDGRERKKRKRKEGRKRERERERKEGKEGERKGRKEGRKKNKMKGSKERKERKEGRKKRKKEGRKERKRRKEGKKEKRRKEKGKKKRRKKRKKRKEKRKGERKKRKKKEGRKERKRKKEGRKEKEGKKRKERKEGRKERKIRKGRKEEKKERKKRQGGEGGRERKEERKRKERKKKERKKERKRKRKKERKAERKRKEGKKKKERKRKKKKEAKKERKEKKEEKKKRKEGKEKKGERKKEKEKGRKKRKRKRRKEGKKEKEGKEGRKERKKKKERKEGRKEKKKEKAGLRGR